MYICMYVIGRSFQQQGGQQLDRSGAKEVAAAVKKDLPRPSIYPLEDPKYRLFGTIYPYLRVQGGSQHRIPFSRHIN